MAHRRFGVLRFQGCSFPTFILEIARGRQSSFFHNTIFLRALMAKLYFYIITLDSQFFFYQTKNFSIKLNTCNSLTDEKIIFAHDSSVWRTIDNLTLKSVEVQVILK